MTQKTRLERLEKVSGGGVQVMAVHYEHEDFVTVSQPPEIRGESMPLEDFRNQFPDAILIEVEYVDTPTPPQKT